jgi:hypothetical protein
MATLNRSWARRRWAPRKPSRAVLIYQVTNRLHAGHTVYVSGDKIAATVSGWLAEVGTQSPLVDDFVQAVQAGDWHAAHAIGEHLSVQVSSLPAS